MAVHLDPPCHYSSSDAHACMHRNASDSELNSFRCAKNAILANILHLWVSRPRTSSGLPAVLSCRKRRRSRRRRRRCCRAGCGGSGGSSRRRRRACLAERGPRVARRCAATVRPEEECRASFDVHHFVFRRGTAVRVKSCLCLVCSMSGGPDRSSRS